MGCGQPSWANEAGGGHPHASGVTRQEALRIFDLLYRKAWRDMGGASTLGNTAVALRSAYEGSLIGGVAPHFWLEMPLLGEAHSDLHVSYDYEEMVPGARFAPGAGFGYQALFDWFCVHGTQHTGIDLTFDLVGDAVAAVGAYVSFHRARKVDFDGFCRALGCPDDSWRCRAMADAFPPGWQVWYVSPFQGRKGNPVRAAALATDKLQQRFAADPSVVREHLAHLGIASIPDELCRRVSELARLPLTLEWRVTMDAQGTMLDRCDVSFYLSNTYMSLTDVRSCFGTGGAGTSALGLFEQWGIADERWHDVVAGAFAKGGPFRRDDGSVCTLVGVCSPSCFMMPWRQGAPLPAKVYPKMEAFFGGGDEGTTHSNRAV